MVIRRKGRLCFVAVVLVAMGFPMQVYWGSPYPVLLPYLIFGWNILWHLLVSRRAAGGIDARLHRRINWVIGLYVWMVLLNTGWQTAFGLVSPFEAASALLIFLFPILLYWYFGTMASELEIRATLRAMVVGGLIVGSYFVYDSYLKIAKQQITSYDQLAYEYAVNRGSSDPREVGTSRIATNYRSYGLLESPAVSGTWVVLGSLAALTLVPAERRLLRRMTVVTFGTLIVIALNFTSIVAFVVVMIFSEYRDLVALRGNPPKMRFRQLLSFGLVLSLVAGAVVWLVGGTMTASILQNLAMQRDLALGTGNLTVSAVGIFISNVAGYVQHLLQMPLTLLLGDGFTSYGGAKGGDVGLIETLERFGVPLFTIVMVGLWRLWRAGLRQARVQTEVSTPSDPIDRGRLLQFCASVTLLVFVMEVHYSVWSAKPVLPIVFFTLALYGRYLSPARRRAKH